MSTRFGNFLSNKEEEVIKEIIFNSFLEHHHYGQYKNILEKNKGWLLASMDDSLDCLFSDLLNEVYNCIEEYEDEVND